MHIISLTTSLKGGAGITAIRLDTKLRSMGIDNTILIMKNRWPAYLDAIIGKFLISDNPIFHSYNFIDSGIAKKINALCPDIVHIHWVGAGFLSPESIAKIKAPIVWTLHDLWPLSGAEHLPGSMTRFKDGYLRENRPSSEAGFDLNRLVWERKKIMLGKKKITFVAPSKYIFHLAQKSPLIKNHPLVYIPNGIDTNIFGPKKTKVISGFHLLFSAMSPFVDRNKGIDLLREMLKALPLGIRKNLHLHIVGSETPKEDYFAGIINKITYHGILNDEKQLARIYNSVDITVIPSKMETLSYVALESLSCGTPVIAFAVDGIVELIKNGQNGFLIQPYDIDEFAKKLISVINKKKIIKNSCNYLPKQNSYDIKTMTNNYIKLYLQTNNPL